MTRVLLYGASGMLGTAIREQAPDDIEIVDAGVRLTCDVDADERSVMAKLPLERVDAVINCMGRRPFDGGNIHIAYINGVWPHILAGLVSPPVIHVSTDCVLTLDSHYARTKLAGESEHAINVRTSFVGPRHSLWPWLVGKAETPGTAVDGWANAVWSGSTVDAVAKALLELARDPGEPRTINMATKGSISKYRLLEHLAIELKLPVVINMVFEPRIDRRMVPDIVLPPFAEALREMVDAE